MTHDEIAQLDADGLDAAIDKAKGITHGKEVGTLLGFPVAYFPKKWSTDIRAAWDLAEDMPTLLIEKTVNPKTRYLVSFWRNMCRYKVEGDTAPLAICRAWLMWKQT